MKTILIALGSLILGSIMGLLIGFGLGEAEIQFYAQRYESMKGYYEKMEDLAERAADVAQECLDLNK